MEEGHGRIPAHCGWMHEPRWVAKGRGIGPKGNATVALLSAHLVDPLGRHVPAANQVSVGAKAAPKTLVLARGPDVVSRATLTTRFCGSLLGNHANRNVGVALRPLDESLHETVGTLGEQDALGCRRQTAAAHHLLNFETADHDHPVCRGAGGCEDEVIC